MFGDPIDGFAEFYSKMVTIDVTVGEIYSGLIYALKNKSDDYYPVVAKYVLHSRKK